MPFPLQHGDPPGLGPFRLQARLRADAAGVVYLGHAPDGRPVSVAVLTRGAAFDPSARDRFTAAIRAGEGPPVVGGDAAGPAPWVATPYAGDRPGAERFLEPVIVTGTIGKGRAEGPDFLPYWINQRDPAIPVVAPATAPAPPPPSGAETRKAVFAALVTLAIMLLMLLLLAWLLLTIREVAEEETPQPLPSPTLTPTPPPQPSPSSPGPSNTPDDSSPTPTQDESGSPSGTPTSGDEEDEEEGDPL